MCYFGSDSFCNILALYVCMKDQCHPLTGLWRNQNTSVLPLAKLFRCLLFIDVSSYWYIFQFAIFHTHSHCFPNRTDRMINNLAFWSEVCSLGGFKQVSCINKGLLHRKKSGKILDLEIQRNRTHKKWSLCIWNITFISSSYTHIELDSLASRVLLVFPSNSKYIYLYQCFPLKKH